MLVTMLSEKSKPRLHIWYDPFYEFRKENDNLLHTYDKITYICMHFDYKYRNSGY